MPNEINTKIRAPQNKYINEIDGLRAIAIIVVMLFHANSSWVPGGYLGVDIFFVISGFLITRIILNALAEDQFSFGSFYASRIRRLLPALFAMILIVTCASCLFLLPRELMRSSAAALTNLVFLSNYYFARFYDYFSAGVTGQPLIHTWSLGVEIQFYLIWPLLLTLLYRKAGWRMSHLMMLTGILMVGSVCFSEYLITTGSNNFNYYSNFTRAAELLGGCYSGMYLIKNGRISSLYAIVGSLAVIFSLAFVRNEASVPGVASLPVVIGTMLFLVAERSPVVKLLTFTPLSLIGKISYSLYLWHWPFYSTFKYMAAREQLTFIEFFSLTVPIIVISWLSYKYIEIPVRESKSTFKFSAKRYYALPAIIIIVVGLPLKLSDGELFKYGFGKQISALDFIDSKKYCAGNYEKNCRIGSQTAVNNRNALFGDSHAAQYMPFFDIVGQSQGFSLNAYAGNGCSPIFTKKELQAESPRPGSTGTCEDMHLIVAQHLKEYDRIYIAAYWKNYLSADQGQFLVSLKETLSYLHQYGAQIILIQDSPAWKNNAIERYVRNQNFHDKLKFTLPFRNNYIKTEESESAELELKKLAMELPYVTYLPVIDNLQSVGVSLPINDHVLMYKDSNHLNDQGSHLLAHYYINNLPAIIPLKIPQ